MVVQGDIQLYRNINDGLAQNPNSPETSFLLNDQLSIEQQRQLEESAAKREQLDHVLKLYPNPTTGVVQITGLESDDTYYQVFDDKGGLLSHKERVVNQSFSLTNYSKGTYYIRIYSGSTYAVRKVVKM